MPSYIVAPDSAYRYAREIDLPELAAKGLGNEWIDKFFAARMASLRPQIAQARVNAGASVMNRLGEETETGQHGKAMTAIAAFQHQNAVKFMNEAEVANETMRQGYASQWLGMLQHQDSMQIQTDQFNRQMEMQKEDPFDKALRVASIFV